MHTLNGFWSDHVNILEILNFNLCPFYFLPVRPEKSTALAQYLFNIVFKDTRRDVTLACSNSLPVAYLAGRFCNISKEQHLYHMAIRKFKLSVMYCCTASFIEIFEWDWKYPSADHVVKISESLVRFWILTTVEHKSLFWGKFEYCLKLRKFSAFCYF